MGIVHIHVHLHVHHGSHVHQEALRTARRGIFIVHDRRLGGFKRLGRGHRCVLGLFGLFSLLRLGLARLLLARLLRLFSLGFLLRFRLHFGLRLGLLFGLRFRLLLRLRLSLLLGLHFRLGFGLGFSLRFGLLLSLHFRLLFGLGGLLLALRLIVQAEGAEQVAQTVIVFLLLFHHRQANQSRLAAKQAKQALGAFLNDVDMDIRNRYAQRREASVNGFLRRLAGKFLRSHFRMPTSSALAALRSCAAKYLLKPTCSTIA